MTLSKPKLNDLEFESAGGGIKNIVVDTSDCGLVKPCSKCRSWKRLDDFHNDSTSPTGRTYYCKKCARKKTRDNHAIRMTDPAWVDSRRQWGRNFARERKKAAVEYKGGVCEDCGVKYPDYIYDFHHLDGSTKTDNPSAILKREWSKAKQEMDTCLLLCANCHRERHYGPKLQEGA